MNGSVDAFFVGRRARRAIWLAAILMSLATLWQALGMTLELTGIGVGIPWWLRSAAVVSFGCLSALFFWGVRSFRLPIVEVSERSIQWRLPTQIRPVHRTLPIEEIQSLDWSTDSHRSLLVATRSGGKLRINVSSIDKNERNGVYDAITARMSSVQGG